MSFLLVGSFGNIIRGTSPQTPVYAQATTAANSAYCWVEAGNVGTITLSVSGWTQAVTISHSGGPQSELWYKANISASETAPQVSNSAGGGVSAFLAEYSGGALSGLLDQTGTATGTSSPVSVTAAAADSAANNLVLLCGAWKQSAAATGTFSDSGGYSTANDNGSSNVTPHIRGAYQILTAGGSSADTDSQAFTGSNITAVALVIATFKAAVPASPGRVLVISSAISRAARW